MSSREIAELTGKQHRNVLTDCDKLNAYYRKMGLAEISAGVYQLENTGSQRHRQYLLTKMQTFDLMTGYSTELRIKVNRRWEELELANQAMALPSKKELAQMVIESEERDPIHTNIYYEIVKIRKWVAFLGVVTIIGLAAGLLALLSSLSYL